MKHKLTAQKGWLTATSQTGEKYAWFTGSFKDFDQRAKKIIQATHSPLKVRPSTTGELVIDLGV